MRFVVAGGGVAGLAIGLAVGRAGHEAVVLERDDAGTNRSPLEALDDERKGIPHYHQPHAFLPRGRRELSDWAPDVLDALHEAGAEPQSLVPQLTTAPEPGDEDLVYLWARRPLIEWALRRAAAAQDGVTVRSGVRVVGLESTDGRATGVALEGGEILRGEVVVDALGRYRPPAGWPRTDAQPTDSGGVYYCRYFELADGAEHLPAPLLNPRGDLGYMGFNTFRGDNRTYAIVLATPSADRALRILRHDDAFMEACRQIRPIDISTSPEHGRPITDVLPMGGLMNVDRTAPPPVRGLVVAGDALCHTDPAFSYGISLTLAQGRELAAAAAENDPDATAERYLAAVAPEAAERHALACGMDAARTRRWAGEPIDISRADGAYPLFTLVTALAAAPHDDHVLRRTIRRIGLLDRTGVFDGDSALHDRIEAIFSDLTATPPPPAGPPRDELLAALSATRSPA
jgi:2-polyprenyl-6-methoxyphenol hydroxylase-like FAD-dependent oxidoreductase